MAVSGGVTTAYKCVVHEYLLKVEQTSYPKAECARLDAAVGKLERGESVIVASADIAKLRQRLASYGIG